MRTKTVLAVCSAVLTVTLFATSLPASASPRTTARAMPNPPVGLAQLTPMGAATWLAEKAGGAVRDAVTMQGADPNLADAYLNRAQRAILGGGENIDISAPSGGDGGDSSGSSEGSSRSVGGLPAMPGGLPQDLEPDLVGF